MGDGIVFVGMALGASHGRAHPGGEGGIHAINHRNVAELLVVGPSFVVGLRIAVKGGGDQLIFGRLGQQVPGQLLDGELIKRQVFVESPYDVIPISPNGTGRIVRVTGRVGITGQIQPCPRPMFSELGTGKQAGD